MNKDDLIREAKERLQSSIDWESNSRRLAIEDYKFYNADSDNQYQWADTIRQRRELEQRPMLTINKTRQHVLQIINDARQNKTEIRINPVGDGATYESAQVMEDLVRHIQYQSRAQDVYIRALNFAVTMGIGYWRVVTDFVDDKSVDQDIYIQPIKDPLTVLLDPDIQEQDGSDARFAFVYEDIPKDLFNKKYPKYKDRAPVSALDAGQSEGVPKDHIRVCEYFKKTEKNDTLFILDTGSAYGSELSPEIVKGLKEDPTVKHREVMRNNIKWYLIIGNEIAEERNWAGTLIPIVRVIGEETIIDGKLDRKGHVRALKDPQRMYNYWSSSAVEFVALQSKSPYMIALESVEGVEQYWDTANTVNHAYLPYKGIGEGGQMLPQPSRAQPPQPPQAFIAGMQTAAQELMMASGQYESQMGEKSNEKSGVAIQERQRQGDNATYHYIDNLAIGIRYTGRIIIDLIPYIYDTPRVIKIVQENGDESEINIQPQADQLDTKKIQALQNVLDPQVGRYAVQSDVGPEFATKRQEAFNSLIQLAAQSPIIMQAAGDLVMKAADFPMADELAERLKNMLPAQALGGASPELQAAQSQVQQLSKTVQDLLEQLGNERALTRERSQQKDINVYKAETDRMDVMAKVDPVALLPAIHGLINDALKTHLAPVLAASSQSLANATSLPVDNTGQNGVMQNG